MPSFLPPPIDGPLGAVTTDRLELRRFETADLDGLATVFANPEVWRFPHGRAFTRPETAMFLDRRIAEWDECGFGCWIAIHREQGRIIGYIGLSVPMFLPEILPAVEVGWRLDPAFWGRGLATEGARAALREGFLTLGLDEITSIPQVDNPSSGKVCGRIGMTLDRIVTIPANERRGEVQAELHRLTRSAWEATTS